MSEFDLETRRHSVERLAVEVRISAVRLRLLPDDDGGVEERRDVGVVLERSGEHEGGCDGNDRQAISPDKSHAPIMSRWGFLLNEERKPQF